MNQDFKNLRELESELFYPFISSLGFRSELTEVVKFSTQRRKDSFTQKELYKVIGIPLTKIKPIYYERADFIRRLLEGNRTDGR